MTLDRWHGKRLEAIQTRLKEEILVRVPLGKRLYISEFPRSGGSWVQRIMECIMRQESSTVRMHVQHQHWPYRRWFSPAVTVVRDGRDVVTSLYFFHVRHVITRSPWASRVMKWGNSVLGPGWHEGPPQEYLPTFISALNHHPHGGLINAREDRIPSWPDHVQQWDNGSVLRLRYEDVLANTPASIVWLLDHFGWSADPADIEKCARDHSFAAEAGRDQGDEDIRSELRKGIVGDWRNHFGSEAARAFIDYGGQALIALGYEHDHSWADQLGHQP